MDDEYGNQRNVRIVDGPNGESIGLVRCPDGQLRVMDIASSQEDPSVERATYDGRSVEMRLAAIEARQAEIERKLDNLTEYVRALMTNSQKLRCTRPDR